MKKMTPRTSEHNMPDDRLFLERPRVERILEQAFQSRVVIVTAGEGNGKTWAVNSFLQKDPRKTVWLQLSELDNLGWRFWENYTGEVARLNRKAAKALVRLGFPESYRQFERYVDILRQEVTSPEPHVTVFDDFHLLTSPSVLLHLERVLTAAGSKSTIVLISRTEPALNTVGLLARGRLSRITAEDLRFSEEEIGEYFHLHRIPLEAETVSRIAQATEGWALAVDLILREIKTGSPDREQPAWDRMMNPIRKIEEAMFAGMGGELQKFLIKISLMDHWPRDLLERLDPEGKAIAAMEPFSSLIRFDAYLHGFRIHRLFLDFLREKQGELSPAEIREVYDTEARWCFENNLIADAAINYERAGDYSGILQVINSQPVLVSVTVAAFFLAILDRILPPEAPDRDGGGGEDLLYLRFVIRPRLLVILRRFQESAEAYDQGIRYIEALAPGPWRSGCLAQACCGRGILMLLSCHHTRDYGFAPWFERSYHYFLENPQALETQTLQTSVGPYSIRVGAPVEPGEIETFIAAMNLAVPFAADTLNGFLYGADNLGRAELAYYQGDLSRAEQFARQAAYQGRGKKQYEIENYSLLYLLRICVHIGSFAEIKNLERQFEAQLEIPEYPNSHALHDVVMGRFYIRIGLMEKVAPWLRAPVEEAELNGMFRGFDVLIKARCFFAEKNYPAMLQVLEEEEARRDLGGFILGKLEIMVLEAAARYHLGETEAALDILEAAYLTAAPQGLDMPFIELEDEMRMLAGAALGRKTSRIPRSWLEKIRNKASAYSRQVALAAKYYQGGESREQKPAIYLTRQERTVLSGLSRGLNRKDIAAEAGLSLSSVKTTISGVYAKLGAVNRADAIRIAGLWGIV
jgi:LuxR family maltose regulon positive regulatory protein